MTGISVFDVARYILQREGTMSAIKLHKLVYYSQAWSLVWDERLLFPNAIEAWAKGPVVPELYQVHSGKFSVSVTDIPGHPERLDNTARETLDAVLDFYGVHTAQWLSDLTHNENPWRQARVGVPDGMQSHALITPAAMHAYYSSLPDNE